jgi:hypothetical protein
MVIFVSVAETASGTRCKRLLALDGGGVRGVLSIEILAAIERVVGAPLSSYFDYVAGTSTGAILAACVSLGMSVDEIRTFFIEIGPSMFHQANALRRFRYKYDDVQLAAALRNVFSGSNGIPLTLGSPELKTLLLLVLRNATTDSPWPLSNNPRALFNDRRLAECNLDFPLWQLIRASTAAPTYFPPERIAVGSQSFVFVDGGVTTYNNPAFLLFLHATLRSYRLCWPTGPEKLLLVSVGTGATAQANDRLKPGEMNLLYNMTSVPAALLHAALVEQDLLCRVFGRCLFGDAIDLELGDLRSPVSGPAAGFCPQLFTYVRYSADLSAVGLERLGLSSIRPEAVQRLDSIDHLDELRLIGRSAARNVSVDHFVGFE